MTYSPMPIIDNMNPLPAKLLVKLYYTPFRLNQASLSMWNIPLQRSVLQLEFEITKIYITKSVKKS